MSFAQLLADYFDRAKSHLYGIFFFWLTLFHAPVVFTSLFVDQELIYRETSLLKNEYVSATYFNFSDNVFWVREGVAILFSVFFTYLMIWIFPKTLIKWAYSREIEDQFQREDTKLKKEIELSKKKESLLTKEAAIVVKEEKIADKKNTLENKEQRVWSRDYQDFRRNNNLSAFNYLIDAVYKHSGQIKVLDAYGKIRFQVPSHVLAWVDSLGLVTFNASQEKVVFTEKGKYFLKRFQDDNSPRG